MRKIILFLFVFLFSVEFSLAATIVGQVYSSAANEPIVGVKISVDGVDTAITDLTGAFALSATSDAIITAEKDGYVAMSALVSAVDETFTFTLAPIWVLTSVTQVYSDVPEETWFAPLVKNLYEQQILSAKSVKPYRPGDQLTRAELAMLATRAAGFLPSAPTQTSFCDVAPNDWFAGVVEFMSAQKWLGGYSSTSCASAKEFRPSASVTRAEAVKMILNVFGKKVMNKLATQTCPPLTFSDVSANDWFTSFVGQATCLGLVKGYADGTFGPNKTVNRAEIAGILNQAIKVLR